MLITVFCAGFLNVVDIEGSPKDYEILEFFAGERRLAKLGAGLGKKKCIHGQDVWWRRQHLQNQCYGFEYLSWLFATNLINLARLFPIVYSFTHVIRSSLHARGTCHPPKLAQASMCDGDAFQSGQRDSPHGYMLFDTSRHVTRLHTTVTFLANWMPGINCSLQSQQGDLQARCCVFQAGPFIVHGEFLT